MSRSSRGRRVSPDVVKRIAGRAGHDADGIRIPMTDGERGMLAEVAMACDSRVGGQGYVLGLPWVAAAARLMAAHPRHVDTLLGLAEGCSHLRITEAHLLSFADAMVAVHGDRAGPTCMASLVGSQSKGARTLFAVCVARIGGATGPLMRSWEEAERRVGTDDPGIAAPGGWRSATAAAMCAAWSSACGPDVLHAFVRGSGRSADDLVAWMVGSGADVPLATFAALGASP